ncbi:hypothetical protein D3C73_763160 [compost metagenome]
MAADRLAETEHGALDQGVAVDGVGQGAAHPHVVERRLGVVDAQDDLAFRGADDDAEARVALELGDVLGRGIVGEGVHVAGADGGEGGGRVADEAEDDGVQARGRAPIAVAADQGQLAAALPALQLEGTGADRGDGVGRGARGRDHDRVAPGQDIGQGRHRPGQMDAQGRRIDDLDLADRFEQGLLGVGRPLGGDPVEREFGDRGVERRTVREGHAASQMEGPGQAVGRGFPRVRQRRGDGAVLGQFGQALEDVGVDHLVHRRRRARGRVEVRRLQRQAQHQAVARGGRLGLGRGGGAQGERKGQRQREQQPRRQSAPRLSGRWSPRPCLRHRPLISPLRRGRSSSAYVMDFPSRHRISGPHQGWRASEAGQAVVASVAAARAASNSSLARAKSAWNAGSAFSRVTMVAPTMRPASTSLG